MSLKIVPLSLISLIPYRLLLVEAPLNFLYEYCMN